MNNILSNFSFEPGKYFIAEIGNWVDENGNNYANGICYGESTGIIKYEYDEDSDSYCPAIQCKYAIYADNAVEKNGSIGIMSSIIYRDMTEDEENYFMEKIKEYI